MASLRRSLVLAGVLCLLASAAAAQDAPDPDRDRRARQHFLSGSAYFETGDYGQAVRAFRASYEESPHGEILFNIYLCEERIGNLAAAIEALTAFLATPIATNRSALQERLERLRERQARGETRIAAGELDEAHPIDPETGEPRIGPAPGDRAPVDDESSGSPTLAILGFAVAAAGLVTFAIGGVLTLGEDSRLRDECAPTCDDDELSTIGTTRLVADIGAGVALAGAIVGLIALLTRSPDEPSGERAAVRLRGLSLEASF
jgi:tetratricopeptide (TPR) repeat protein